MKTMSGTGSVPILRQEITSNSSDLDATGNGSEVPKALPVWPVWVCLSSTAMKVAPPTAVSGPGWNIFRALCKSRVAKNLYTNSKRLTFSCRMTWDWSGRVNLYSRQILTLPRKTNNICNIAGPGATSVMPGSGRLSGLPRPLLCNPWGWWPILSRKDVS